MEYKQNLNYKLSKPCKGASKYLQFLNSRKDTMKTSIDTKNSEDLNYYEQHLRGFILERNAFNIRQLEIDCNVPKDTIRHFIKEKRSLPEKHMANIEKELFKYGYRSFNEE